MSREKFTIEELKKIFKALIRVYGEKEALRLLDKFYFGSSES